MGAGQWKAVRVFEIRHFLKRLRLPVARRAVLTITTVMYVFVTLVAGLIEPEEPFRPRRELLHASVRMALIASQLRVAAGQLKVQPIVFKPDQVRDTGQDKAAGVGELELGAMVFRVAFRTVLSQFTRHLAVKTGARIELSSDLLVALGAGDRHGLLA